MNPVVILLYVDLYSYMRFCFAVVADIDIFVITFKLTALHPFILFF